MKDSEAREKLSIILEALKKSKTFDEFKATVKDELYNYDSIKYAERERY